MGSYTVNKLAKLAGITVRALHHYDEIGLLQPKRGEENSYRLYSEADLLTLQEIMFLRELEFSLSEIKEILSSPTHDRGQILEDQKRLLQIKKDKLTKLIKIIDQNMTNTKPQDKFTAFSDDKMNEYKAEAKARWGSSDAYKQSQERIKRMSKEDLTRIGEEQKALTREIAGVMDLPVSDQKVQDLIKRHHAGIEIFYDLNSQMYRNLAEMYISDPRFTKTYDDVKPGLAQFLRDAIFFYTSKK